MNYIVTGLCAVLSFIICILSHLYIDKRKADDEKAVSEDDTTVKAKISDKNEEETSNEKSTFQLDSETHTGLITMFLNKIKELDLKQWILIIVAVVFASFSAFWVQHYNITWISVVKIFIAVEMLMSAMIVDMYIKKIPNVLVVSVYILRCALFIPEYIFFKDNFLATLIGSLIGFAVSFIVFYLLSLVTKGGIGMGDVKLISAMGCLVGIGGTFYSLFYGMFVCMITAICFLVSKKRKLKDHFPFGPFIFFGFIAAILLGTF